MHVTNSFSLCPLPPLPLSAYPPLFLQAVQSNPGMLQAVIQQISAQSPEMLAAIQGNPAAFLAMLNEVRKESRIKITRNIKQSHLWVLCESTTTRSDL